MKFAPDNCAPLLHVTLAYERQRRFATVDELGCCVALFIGGASIRQRNKLLTRKVNERCAKVNDVIPLWLTDSLWFCIAN
jgi:hypothetical protein